MLPSADPEAETGNHRAARRTTVFPVSRARGRLGPAGNPSLPRRVRSVANGEPIRGVKHLVGDMGEEEAGD